MEQLRAIQSQKQYKEFLSKADELMDLGPAPNSENGRLLETLVILIED